MAPKRKRTISQPVGPTNYIECMQYCDNVTFNAQSDGSKPFTAKAAKAKRQKVSATAKIPLRPRRNASAQPSYYSYSPNSTRANSVKLRYVTPEDFLTNKGGVSTLEGGQPQSSHELTPHLTRAQAAGGVSTLEGGQPQSSHELTPHLTRAQAAGGVSTLEGGQPQSSHELTPHLTRAQAAVMAWDEHVDDSLSQEFVSALEHISSFYTPPVSPETSFSDMTISLNKPGPSK